MIPDSQKPFQFQYTVVTSALHLRDNTHTSPTIPDAIARRLFALVGGLSGIGYAAAALLVRADNSTEDFLRFFTIYFLLACVWGMALWLTSNFDTDRRAILIGAVLFRLLLLPAPSAHPLGWKVAILACDFAVLALLSALAGPGARGATVLLAYAWNPLVIKEFAGSAHLDAAVACLLLAALRMSATATGSLLLSLAAWIQPAVLLLTPAFWKRAGWRAMLAPAVVTAALAAGWQAGPATRPFNAALSRVIPSGLALAILALLLLWWMRRDDGTPAALQQQSIWLLGAFLLCSPRVDPWSVTWLIPIAALELSWFWLALSGAIFLAYHAYLPFAEIPALTALEYAMPVAVWLLLRKVTRTPENPPMLSPKVQI